MLELKDKIFEVLGACLQSEFAAKLVQSDAIQSAFLKGLSKSSELKQLLESRMAHLAEALPFARKDALETFEADIKDARAKAQMEHAALAERLTKLEERVFALEAKMASVDESRAKAMADHESLEKRLSKLEVTCDPQGNAETLDTAALPAIKATRSRKKNQ